MWVCLHALSTVLYFNSLVLPFFSRNYTCKKRRFASLRSPQSASCTSFPTHRVQIFACTVLQVSTAGEKPFQKPVFIHGHVCLSISFYRLSRVGLENALWRCGYVSGKTDKDGISLVKTNLLAYRSFEHEWGRLVAERHY